jgi:amino acid adenylation domain-containing protein
MQAERGRLAAPPAGFRPLAPVPFVHEVILEHCAARPEAAAVGCAGKMLSYGELAASSARIAHALRACPPESVVGVLLERSVHAVAAMLGIWRAGLVYLPLDPMYPPDRLRFMLRDSSARLLIGTRATAGALASDAALPLLAVDELGAGDGDAHAHAMNVSNEPAPERRDRGSLVPAYLLYTSGSTGRPKGALCTHRGLAAIMVHDYRTQRGPLRRDEAHAVWTSVSFDVWLYEVLAALVVGARAELVPDEVRFDAPAYVGWLRDNAIAGAFVPASTIGLLADAIAARPQAFALRRMLVGSEPVDEGQVRRALAAAPALEVHNGYGTTECTIISSFHGYHAEPPLPGVAPLGRAIDGSWLAVLDDDGEPLPPGTLGELCIGGLGVALGYCNNPELSAARFHDAGEPELRYYRTGDLATLPADGPARFHGRKDRQFKLRGVRMEPGDVESALRRMDAVREAVVGVRTHRGREILVAYVQTKAGPLAAKDLRRHVTRFVPPAMVPEKFVFVGVIPTTVNGKVDHDALTTVPFD